MGAGEIAPFSDLAKHLKSIESDPACFVDTSILFSATYDLDAFNTESEVAFDLLAKAGCSIFTNVNVRSEFLENHRKNVQKGVSSGSVLADRETDLVGPQMLKQSDSGKGTMSAFICRWQLLDLSRKGKL
jgi:hypothetical protein